MLSPSSPAGLYVDKQIKLIVDSRGCAKEALQRLGKDVSKLKELKGVRGCGKHIDIARGEPTVNTYWMSSHSANNLLQALIVADV